MSSRIQGSDVRVSLKEEGHTGGEVRMGAGVEMEE